MLANKEPPKAGLFDHLFDLLGRRTSLSVGRECASSLIWMLCILSIRWALGMLSRVPVVGFLSQVPHAVVCALPLLMQLLDSYFSFIGECFPLLPVRIVETVLGRMSVSWLALVVVPSQFVGCVMGIVVFKTLLPFAVVEVGFSSIFLSIFFFLTFSSGKTSPPPKPPPHQIKTHVQPLTPPSTNVGAGGLASMGLEAALLCAYSCLVIAIPELLQVNRASRLLLSLPVGLVLLLAAAADSRFCFHPTAGGALWLVDRLDAAVTAGHGGSLTIDQALVPLEGFMGPALGGIIAGLVCLKYFPDDPASWKRK